MYDRVLKIELEDLAEAAEAKRKQHAEGELTQLKAEMRLQEQLNVKFQSHNKIAKVRQIVKAETETQKPKRPQTSDPKILSTHY